MRILALETTERIGSIALSESGVLIAQQQLPSGLRSAQSLAPAIRESLERINWTPQDVDLVAVTSGPGSFTGLRIGIATAKAFAYAVGAELLGIDTHETLAAACPSDVTRLGTVIDAQRGQVVARTFKRDPSGQLLPITDSELLDIDTWFDSLTAETRVTGPILHRIAGRLPTECVALPSELWNPSAASVALLAHQHYAAGRRDDLWQLVPVYSRPSAAEEKRRAR